MEYLRDNLGYDDANIKSILTFAKHLENKNFYQVLMAYQDSLNKLTQATNSYSNRKRKGGLGNLLEEVYFGFKANSDQEPDFPKVGVELKTTPYEDAGKNNLYPYRAGERLVITMINYNKPIEPNFEESAVWHKIRQILLIEYYRDQLNKKQKRNLYYKITHVQLFTPPPADLKIIKDDYQFIIEKIKAGNAHELSEADTMYLGACTKGTNSSSLAHQYYNHLIPAKKRAFCFKTSYMTVVLNEYILNTYYSNDCIIKNPADLKDKTLADILIEKIDSYKGFTQNYLYEHFHVNPASKHANALVVYRILGLNNTAVELKKANIQIKTIRINKSNLIEQHLRLDDVNLCQMAAEKTFEESQIYNRLSSTKFLLIIFKEGLNNEYLLAGSQLWNMPISDIYKIKFEWEAICKSLRSGVTFTRQEQKNGIIIQNNLPGSKDRIYHLRTHKPNTFYQFSDGTSFGKGTLSDTDLLPDGQRMTRQADWLSKSYMLLQLDKKFKNEH